MSFNQGTSHTLQEYGAGEINSNWKTLDRLPQWSIKGRVGLECAECLDQAGVLKVTSVQPDGALGLSEERMLERESRFQAVGFGQWFAMKSYH